MTDFFTSFRPFLAGLATVALLALAAPATAESPAGGTFGGGVGDAQLVPIADLVATPERWDGQAVRVQGEITGVCPKKGCWMELKDGDASVRVKVEDDVIVFPADATGQKATAQGRLEIREMSREDYLGWARHQAEEKGEAFDAASVGGGPFRLIQIRGTGAEIHG
ncbi:MAG: DUF4920 domain-containing protein [Acidobacteriota bacterium]